MQLAREELNLRPLPCQQTTGNRCARSRFPRLLPTADAEGKRSVDVELNALLMDPDAPDLTFGPQPGDYLSRNRSRGVATPPRGSPAGRGQHEFPWLRRLCRPAVHRFDQHPDPDQDLCPRPNRMSPLQGTRCLLAIFLLDASRPTVTQNFLCCTISACK